MTDKGTVMTEETPVKRTRKPRVSSDTKPKQKRHRKSGASAEIDKQLAEHIRELSVVSRQLSEAQGKLQGLSDRYNRLSQEIQNLMQYQRAMNAPANPQSPNIPVQPMMLSSVVSSGTSAVPQIGMPVPPGVGSIPAGPRQPASNPQGNAASEVLRDKDFA